VPNQLSTPPIAPAFVEEIKQLTEESHKAARHVLVLTERVRDVMERMDELQWDLPDDASVDHLRYLTGYDELIETWGALAGHATAAADHTTDLRQPSWYARLLERRRQRIHQETPEV
jgi:hypothetical protein